MTNKSQNGTTIFNILDNTTDLWMTKYIIGEIFSCGGATLYKNPSDQTVIYPYYAIAKKMCQIQGYIFPSKIETIPQCSQNFQNFSDILKLDYMHEGFSLLEILSDNSSF